MRKRARPFLESLESRLTPTTLSIGGTQSFDFTAPGGTAVVQALITGTAGQATFSNDLSQIQITGASSDFELSFSTSDSGVVPIGNINAAGETILGVQTSGPALFQLAGYTGTDFSSGGGLNVSKIVGNVALQNLSSGASVITTSQLMGSIYIAGNLQGQISAGDFWSGNLTVGGDVSVTGGITAANQFTGTVQIGGNFYGYASVGMRAYGQWNIVGSIEAGAYMQAGQDFNRLYVAQEVVGSISAGTNIWMQIGGSIETPAIISSQLQTTTLVGGNDFGTETGGNVYLQVAENIAPSAQITATGSITANYGSTIYPTAVLSAPKVSRNYLPAVESGTVIKSSGYVINTPGVYRLTHDLVYKGTSGDAILINANNVTLNLEGFSIIGTGGTASIAVGVYANNLTGVTIENGTVSGFMYGVRAEVGQYTVTNIRAAGNLYFGLSVIGSGSVVTNNTVLNTGGESLSSAFTIPIGMQVEGNNITVASNIVSGFVLTPFTAETVGIHIDQDPTATITNNFLAMAAPVSAGVNTFASMASPFTGGWGIWINTGPQLANPLVANNVVLNFAFAIGFADTAGVYQFNAFIDTPGGVVASASTATNGGGNVFD